MNASWDWADNFRLHEAACLIAGVPVVPKVTITLEELPAEARQPLKQLMFAHVMWAKHNQSPESTYPKEQMLKALTSDGSEHCLSVMFSREELHRWVQAMGRQSAYSFAPVGNAPGGELSTQPAPAQNTATPAPLVAAGALGGTVTVWTPERKKAANAMMNEQRGQGIKAFAANTAAAFNVSPARLREVLNDKPKKAPAKKTKGVWDV